MNKRPVNKDNPKNIKCEHCAHYIHTDKMVIDKYGLDDRICKITGEYKHYWNRCKSFVWR